MRYVAKRKHKKPCLLCEDAILPGDFVERWCWVNMDYVKPGDVYGGISRVHSTCDKIASIEDLYDESVPTFRETDEQRWDNEHDESIPDDGYKLCNEAERMLCAARVASAALPAKPVRLCPDCGHEARWHKLNGRVQGGAPGFLCIAGVGGQFEPAEFCECRMSPKWAVAKKDGGS